MKIKLSGLSTDSIDVRQKERIIMGKFGGLVKIATIAGPAILKVVKIYGPQLRTLMRENPELFAQIKGRVGKIAGTKTNAKGIKGDQERLNVLREQTTYLYASANTPKMAEKARVWRLEIDQLEKALPLLDVMGSDAKKQEVKKVQTKIDRLSAQILAATIDDDIEDAEVVDPDKQN
ncbi:hypothetical protein JOD55_001182 [Arcanobacterium pluranimalium]|uniref:hypothetical protein n=1 Tax=Arcanobacterium pluranimalium TaxID=108028 RepID=UPI00195D0351|nr:hypothetical protein [Arcanobacterium pluranimalium]MBM7825355.1 hypothetical protein [Arcanobacterium pluranimalium]